METIKCYVNTNYIMIHVTYNKTNLNIKVKYKI